MGVVARNVYPLQDEVVVSVYPREGYEVVPGIGPPRQTLESLAGQSLD